MKKVILGIGIPGSGKSTVLKKLASDYGYAYVCPDDIRAELSGDAQDQSRNGEVWAEAYRRMAEFLEKGDSVVFDATSAEVENRRKFIEFARANGAEKIQGVFVDAPLEVAKERNSGRERTVPEHALDRMHGSLAEHPPFVGDGFDSVFTLDEFHALRQAEMQGENSIIRKEFKTK